MPGLGRMSSPSPKPVSVTRYLTGKFLLTSGSEPQLGRPPGPPVALTTGRLSGNRYGSAPASSAASMITDFPLPPMAYRPPCSRNHWAPWNRQVYVGEYLSSSAVVGLSRFIASTRLVWLVPTVSIPAWEKPTADNS